MRPTGGKFEETPTVSNPMASLNEHAIISIKQKKKEMRNSARRQDEEK